RTFEDGFPNQFIPNAQGVRGQHVAFLASFSSPGVIFKQLSVIYALTKLFVSSFTLVLPFFPTGTYERMEDEGDVATAFTLARILSNIPISQGGPTSLVIFDIHALQERFYFGDNILPCFESGIPLLLNRLQQLPDSDNITIAFPDDGAWKRFHKQLQHFPMIVCAKVREGDQRIVRIKEGDPKGRHVVIVDDLVQSGGTLAECQVRKFCIIHMHNNSVVINLYFVFFLYVVNTHPPPTPLFFLESVWNSQFRTQVNFCQANLELYMD
ncbi:ribose-phosphate pyrophosphokinase 3 mitochondrial, partial [Phtheirospermum japonicum]